MIPGVPDDPAARHNHPKPLHSALPRYCLHICLRILHKPDCLLSYHPIPSSHLVLGLSSLLLHLPTSCRRQATGYIHTTGYRLSLCIHLQQQKGNLSSRCILTLPTPYATRLASSCFRRAVQSVPLRIPRQDKTPRRRTRDTHAYFVRSCTVRNYTVLLLPTLLPIRIGSL